MHRCSKISLSPCFATKDVFPDNYFSSPWDILEPVWGAIATSRKLRHEVLLYFWMKYSFHVTISAFSAPIFSPLSHVWLPDYLDCIQSLTVEIDLTRLGGSASREAPNIFHQYEKINNSLVTIVKGLMNRKGKLMHELHIMCRRYAGSRPGHDDKLISKCPCFPKNPTNIV